MTRQFKYVIIDGLYPIVFSEAMGHSDFKYNGPIHSAGFAEINIEDKSVSCWGESISLNVKYDPKMDHILLYNLFFDPFFKNL